MNAWASPPFPSRTPVCHLPGGLGPWRMFSRQACGEHRLDTGLRKMGPQGHQTHPFLSCFQLHQRVGARKPGEAAPSPWSLLPPLPSFLLCHLMGALTRSLHVRCFFNAENRPCGLWTPEEAPPGAEARRTLSWRLTVIQSGHTGCVLEEAKLGIRFGKSPSLGTHRHL